MKGENMKGEKKRQTAHMKVSNSVGVTLCVLAISVGVGASPTFGDFYSWIGNAMDVSPDGSVVAGRLPDNAGMLWTVANGIQPIGTAPDGSRLSPFGIYVDSGTVHLTGNNDARPDGKKQAFHWSGNNMGVGTVTLLPYLVDGANVSQARNITVGDDGRINVAGWSKDEKNSNDYSVTWRNSGTGWTVTEMGSPTASHPSKSNAVDRNGKLASTWQLPYADGRQWQAMTWEGNAPKVGYVLIPPIIDSPPNPRKEEMKPYDITTDGTFVVGSGVYESEPATLNTLAWRWSEAGGLETLGFLGDDLSNEAFAVNGVAHQGMALLVGGFSNAYQGQPGGAAAWTAFLWDPVRGMRSMKDILENEYSFDLTGWTLNIIRGISDDGTVFCGTGQYGGQQYGWVAIVDDPPIPEPLGACCLGEVCVDYKTEVQCGDLGGTWQGEYTVCSEFTCCPTPFADLDVDGDVDQTDFGIWQLCYTGSSEPPPIPDIPFCWCCDRDSDDNVDQDDFDEFANCVTGPEVPWSAPLTPDCTP